ncbi:MAG: hypothetical protein K6F50_03780 [Kiritimatiellae bacterium]|nr:hypothetical protein [Kiritimatiellia bacterium]
MRRILSAAAAVCLLAFQAFSAAVVVHEADHDCCGDGCQSCMQIQQGVANLHLTGDGSPQERISISPPVAERPATVPYAAGLVHETPVTLKVRMDE